MRPAAQILADNLNRLLEGRTLRSARPETASRIGIGDKTLGNMKSGKGNPQLQNIEAVARYFRVEPWELLKPTGDTEAEIAKLQRMATPRSAAALEAISQAAKAGRLTESDLLLLRQIAERFMGPTD